MKKKKVFSIIIIVTFCLFIFVPVFAYPFFKKLDKEKINENRALASFPKFNLNFFSNFDNYFNDNLPFRSYYINFYSKLTGKIDDAYFRFVQKHNIEYYIEKNDVIAGKNGWYFYSGEGALHDYVGVNVPSEKELKECAEKVIKIDEYLKSKGKTFVIYVAPNKEEIYSENMPDAIKVKNEIKRADMYVNYLKEHTNAKIVYPKQALIDAKADKVTYYQYDSHWNTYGAYIGSMELLRELGMETNYEIEIGDIIRTVGGTDLLKLLNIGTVYENDYGITYRPEISVEIEEINLSAMNRRTTSSNENGKKLMLLGDSFHEFMIQYLSKEFEEAYYGKIYDYFQNNKYKEEFETSDVIVFEAVGRYDENVFEYGLDRFILDNKL